MRIEILEEAETDLLDGFGFYERQGSGLGQYFLDSLFSDIDSLRLHAGIHEQVFGFHRMLSKRFPWAVYYEVVEDRIRGICGTGLPAISRAFDGAAFSEQLRRLIRRHRLVCSRLTSLLHSCVWRPAWFDRGREAAPTSFVSAHM